MKTILRGGAKSHLWDRMASSKTACGLPIEPGHVNLPDGTEPTCARCRAHWKPETAKEATTSAREYLPDSEAGRRRTETRVRAGRILFAYNGLAGFEIASNEDTVVGVGLAAMTAGVDPNEIARKLERVRLDG